MARRDAVNSAFLGVLGVVAVIAVAVSATGALALPAALMLGVIVAPTDPVAVIAIFRRLHVPRDLHAIVEGESIANDGLAVRDRLAVRLPGLGAPSFARGSAARCSR